MDPSLPLVLLGITLILVGFMILVAYLLLSATPGGQERGEVRGGGVVIIVPVPIVFGSDRRTALIAALAGAVLTAVTLLTFYLLKG